MKIFSLIMTFLLSMFTEIHSQNFWAVALEPAPVLNSPDFIGVFGGADGKTIRLGTSGLINEMEWIALPGTVFELLGEYDFGSYKIYHVGCEEYKYESLLFIDSRFVKVVDTKPESRKPKLPPKEEIYKFLDEAVGYKYCWGGNYLHGIKKLLELYQPKGEISDASKREWILEGVDCSGLMYEATNGWTERNTSKLINFGDAVHVEGMTAEEIAKVVKPLDMLVWDGHVIYVYDEKFSIQSGHSKGGVVKLDLLETLNEIISSRKHVDDYNTSDGKRFVVRRWFKDN